MTLPRVSVVVVSRDRPAALARCLAGVNQLFYPAFEVVVVGDASAMATTRDSDLTPITTVPFDRPNISAARNLGIGAAGGDIVVFIDDDAVPEPTWLTHLVAAFDDPTVAAAGGFVIGRNGISFQWRGRCVDGSGRGRDLPSWGTAPRVFDAPEVGAIKTEGTNMAVRRAVLADLGGFDEAFAFYLDETDLNMRLARVGHRVALVPLAQVHHGFAASARRRADRVPLSLFDIGASSEAFWARHLEPGALARARADLKAAQLLRLERHMIAGTIGPPEFRRLAASLCAGMEHGQILGPGCGADIGAAPAFRPVRTPRPRTSCFLFGVRRQRTELTERVRALRGEGHVVSLLILSRTALYHRCAFEPDGVWRQSGGLWGRSRRDGPLIRRDTLAERARAERERIAAVRGLLTNAEQ